MNNSILPPQVYGLIYVTGLYGTGKTTFATTAENPKLTAIIDFDLKFKGEAQRHGFWYRSPEHVQDILSFDYPQMTAWFRQAIADIPQGTTVVTIDNAAPLEGLLGYIVSQAPEKYGVNPGNAKTGAYGGVNPGINRLWKNITTHLQARGVKVIFVVSHVGSPWINGQPVPNKFRGKGSRALQELANLSIVLLKSDSPVPAGLVIKEQFAQRTYQDGEWTVRRVLPLRFPKATWKEIAGYFTKPADFARPKPGEVPSQNELNMYGELLTGEQMKFIESVASGSYVEDGDAPQFIPNDRPAEEPPKTRKVLAPDELVKVLATKVSKSNLIDKDTGELFPVGLHPFGAKTAGLVVAKIQEALKPYGGDAECREILHYLFEVDSADDLTAAQADALLDWLLNGNKDQRSKGAVMAPAHEEARAVVLAYRELAAQPEEG